MSNRPDFPLKLLTDVRLEQEEHSEPLLRGAKEIFYAQFRANGADENGMTFNCPPKTPNSEIDRNIQLVVPVRLTITIPSGVPLASYILDTDLCNFRSYPIHKALESMSMTINNETFNVRLGPYVAALEHYNTSRKLKLLSYSKSPTYGACQAQAFNDLDSGTRSSLAPFAQSISGIAPQNFPFTVRSQTNVAGACVTVVDAVFCESLWISPLHWGEWFDDKQAFKGIKNMSFNFKFLPNAGFRMIAIDNVNLGAVNPTVSMKLNFNASDNFSYSDKTPKLLVNFLEPQCKLPLTNPSFLRQFEFEHYTKTHTSTLAAAAELELSSDYIRLNARPRKFYIFVQRPLVDFTTTPYNPDVFFGIEKINLEWNGVSVLVEAHMAQIYDICVKNGLQLEYGTWRGLGYNSGVTGQTFGSTANQFASTGTIICFDIMDLGLSDQFTTDNTNQFTLKVNVTTKNIAAEALTPVLNVIVLTDYLVKLDHVQNSVDSKIRPALSFFNEKTDCKYQEQQESGLKNIKMPLRRGTAEDQRRTQTQKGDYANFF